MVVALVSRRPGASRTWSRLDAAVYIDLLAASRIGVGREVELQLTLFVLGGNRIGECHKG
jgi:hypothetical protein